MTLPELVEIAKKMRAVVIVPAELRDREKLDSFMEYALNVESEIEEIDLISKGAIPFTLEKRLAIAEAQSLRTAIREFDRESDRLLSRPQTEDAIQAFEHAGHLLKNALGRFIVLAEAVQ